MRRGLIRWTQNMFRRKKSTVEYPHRAGKSKVIGIKIYVTAPISQRTESSHVSRLRWGTQVYE